VDRENGVRAVVLAAEQRPRLQARNFFLELLQVAREVRADVLALFAQFEQDFDVGLPAGERLVGLDDLLQPFARLEDFLGGSLVVPECGVGDLLF